MTDLRKAAEQAYEVPLHELLDGVPENARLVIDSEDGMSTRFIPVGHLCKRAAIALCQALAQTEQEQKTPLKVLNLTVFTENRLRNGRVYDVETLQAMTSRDILAIPDMGKKALKEVMEALDVYAVNMSQERVDETAKGGHDSLGSEWVECVKLPIVVHVRKQRDGETHISTREGITPVLSDDLIMRGVAGEEYPIGRELFERTYTFDTAPSKREWIGLTVNEAQKFYEKYTDREELIYAIDKFLEEKNSG